MLHWFRTRHKPLRRGLLAVFAGVWVFAAVAPCTMAATMCPPDMNGMHCPDHRTPSALDNCDAAAKLDCQLPDLNPPSATSVPADLAVTPMVLATLPIASALPEATAARQRARHAARIPPPRLNLRHAVLLI